MATGTCWASLDSTGERVALGPGDVVVFPHGTAHTLGDHAATPAVEFADLVAGLSSGERVSLPSGGNGDPTTLLCGSYLFAVDGANPLLNGLPHLLHVPAERTRGGALQAAIQLLAGEAGGVDSGSALVVDRLVDLLFVYALRAWLGHQDEASARSWFGALQDPVVGPAVRAVHNDPAYTWTVAALAERSGLSRAPFARRFRQAVGEPPLTYVTRWRMTVAADLLEQASASRRLLDGSDTTTSSPSPKRSSESAVPHLANTAAATQADVASDAPADVASEEQRPFRHRTRIGQGQRPSSPTTTVQNTEPERRHLEPDNGARSARPAPSATCRTAHRSTAQAHSAELAWPGFATALWEVGGK